jgi:hypothetical protein
MMSGEVELARVKAGAWSKKKGAQVWLIILCSRHFNLVIWKNGGLQKIFRQEMFKI